MNPKETIIYIGEIDTHYQKLCYETQNSGFTIIQLSDFSSVEKILQILDVFIIIINNMTIGEAETAMIKNINVYCQESKVALVHIQEDIISVEQIHWLNTK